MTTRQAATVFSSIETATEESTASALFEIKNLKKDLGTLERILSGKQKKLSVTPHDIVHLSLEIFRHVSSILESQALMERIEQDLGHASAHAFLEKHGATLLKKPSGWHWISPAGEMHLLAKPNEPDKAAQKLETLLARPKKRKGGKKPAPAPQDKAQSNS